MDVIRRKNTAQKNTPPQKKEGDGCLSTVLVEGQIIKVDGPAEFVLLETCYQGHRKQCKVAVIAPKTTKIIK